MCLRHWCWWWREYLDIHVRRVTSTLLHCSTCLYYLRWIRRGVKYRVRLLYLSKESTCGAYRLHFTCDIFHVVTFCSQRAELSLVCTLFLKRRICPSCFDVSFEKDVKWPLIIKKCNFSLMDVLRRGNVEVYRAAYLVLILPLCDGRVGAVSHRMTY